MASRAATSMGVADLDPRGRFETWLTSLPGLIIIRLLIVGLFLAAWELASGTVISKFWVSNPSSVARMLWQWVSEGSIWPHLGATLLAMGLGYVIGSVLGVSFGLLLGFLPRFQRVVMPYLAGFYALPKIALAPLLVILLGIDIPSKVALVAITTLFLLLYSTLDGIRDADPDLVETLRLMGADRSEIIRKVLIPATLPWIFTGLRVAVRYSFTAAVLGELIAANKGVGYLIEANAGLYNATGVFAGVSIIVVLSVGFTELLTRAEGTKTPGR
jgi:NitT/TauT family transport system permease protein